MQALQPQIKELQAKHKGDRETLQKEMMELYKREKTNPLMGCLPMFLQIPFFLGLFHVLRTIDPTKADFKKAMVGEYFWTPGEYDSAAGAKLLGASIVAAFKSPQDLLDKLNSDSTTVKIVSAVLILTMVATTYITQRQMISRTGPAAEPTQAMIQKFTLYGIPASLLVSGALFPIGVVIYWVTTNLFSMGQQFWVLKHMPPINASGQEVKEISVETARAMAPKPGVKPVNVKKGPRPQATAEPVTEPATASGDDAPEADLEKRSAAPRRPQDARNRKRKGGRR
jgi:YidC/Oxa1 family membrane protein insertase